MFLKYGDKETFAFDVMGIKIIAENPIFFYPVDFPIFRKGYFYGIKGAFFVPISQIVFVFFGVESTGWINQVTSRFECFPDVQENPLLSWNAQFERLGSPCSYAPRIFLNKPSPEQGASTSIKSNRALSFTSSFGSLLTTTILEASDLIIFSTNIPVRLNIVSLAIINDFVAYVANSVVFPPGAAQRSRMVPGRLEGLGTRNSKCVQ